MESNSHRKLTYIVINAYTEPASCPTWIYPNRADNF